jgi:hypothetical protein
MNSFSMVSSPIHRGNNSILYSLVVNQGVGSHFQVFTDLSRVCVILDMFQKRWKILYSAAGIATGYRLAN